MMRGDEPRGPGTGDLASTSPPPPPEGTPAFPGIPWGWYYACPAADLDRPRRITIGRQEFVAFRSDSGRVGVLHARCIHMGADLSLGRVKGEHLQCPFHEWEFAGDGRCVRIPASDTIPDFAKQTAFPSVVRGGHVFFSNRPAPLFDAPFYDGLTPEDLLPARPFDMRVGMPWYLVAANGFDLQHFRAAHDRTLLAEPVVDQPAPHAMRLRATFGVTGTGFRDVLTRRFAGPEVTMTLTSWCGTMILVAAKFQRTTSYGMVCVTPIDARTSHLRTIVWVPRRRGRLARAIVDPLDAMVRRSFIRAFVKSDQDRTDGIRYTPGTLIDADAVLLGYLRWLAGTASGSSC